MKGKPSRWTRAQANYLFAVLRLSQGAAVDVFNGRDGAWAATVVQAGKRGGLLRLEARCRPRRSARLTCGWSLRR